MSAPILDALDALAQLQGRMLSELLEELARGILKEHGCLPEVSPADLQRVLNERKKKKGK